MLSESLSPQIANATVRRLPVGIRSVLRWIARPRQTAVGSLVRRASRGRIIAGPFAGMTLHRSRFTPHYYLGFILGSHELEIRPVIEQIAARCYSTILNVGAADGYYAVGFARRLPHARVIAFEENTRIHALLARSADVNGVRAQIDIRGRCDLGNFGQELEGAQGDVLVFIDIEGGEFEVLDPEAVRGLRRIDILVESHDIVVPGCTEALIARFSPTHHIQRYRARARVVSDFPGGFLPYLPRLAPQAVVAGMDERRSGIQEWLYLTAKEPVSEPKRALEDDSRSRPLAEIAK
ncbi:hypothetical protein [Rhizobium sp. BK251]|uniref:hypothetical protein n=1 Tax=Rhizobium sp. BK251 TaxID=2512125 RepID=UPI001046FC66|nr:hypothetical protein [Rhizobium sp. BK251]TCL66367.1 FkbM family methyltransferase [Rhizobium sp. BK251]